MPRPGRRTTPKRKPGNKPPVGKPGNSKGGGDGKTVKPKKQRGT